STLADVLMPVFSGRLIDAVAGGAAVAAPAWHSALSAFSVPIALALAAIAMRHIAFIGLNDLLLKMMSDVANEAFYHVQRFSTDWHANSFAGSTVRKITRGMGALDPLNSTVLVALFPSFIILVGSTALLGWHWLVMGVIFACGSLIYLAFTISLSLGYIAPAASLANSWDTRLGGALADAVSCNAVVKAFGAEIREDERLANIMTKWRHRTRRSWVRVTIIGSTQGVTLVALRVAAIGYALLLWSHGQATPGEIAYVLTSFVVLQGYLRDAGMHVRNVQRSVNDMEELVAIHNQQLDVADRPEA
ncbi:MAG: ABC transporter ATP-binding protein, partial [Mesorhizobium sp.]